MPFLTLNGIALPVQVDQLDRPTPELIGDRERAFSGRLTSNQRGLKRVWRVPLVPMERAAATALLALVQQEGVSWSWDENEFSDKGHPPDFDNSEAQASVKKWGAKAFRMLTESVETYTITDGFALPSAPWWTAAYWRHDGSAWHHWIATGKFTSTEAEHLGLWRDGVAVPFSQDSIYGRTARQAVLYYPPAISIFPIGAEGFGWEDATEYELGEVVVVTGTPNRVFVVSTAGESGAMQPSWNTTVGATTTDGGVVWTCLGSNDPYLDDLLWIPAVIPDDWAAQLYAEMNARALPPYPHLRLGGDVVADRPGGKVIVEGEVTRHGTKRLSGELLDVLELELREV